MSTLLTRVRPNAVLRRLVLVAALLVSNVAHATELPQIDPTREWLGPQYAETIIADFKQKYPKFKLVINPTELHHFGSKQADAQQKRRTLKEVYEQMRASYKAAKEANYGKKETLTEVVKALFGTNSKAFLENLEHGHPIEFTRGRGLSDFEKPIRIQRRLEDWLLSQPDGSVYPHDLMVQALRESSGRVVTAWGVVWNLMSNNWMSAPSRNYSSLHQKLFSSTGERHLWSGAAHYVVIPENERVEKEATVIDPDTEDEVVKKTKPAMKMVITKRGDEFSYLYHRVGVELFAMVVGKQTGSAKIAAALASIGALGEAFKYTMTAGLAKENTKRISNDLEAARSGSYLYTLIEKNLNPKRDQRVGARDYLRSNDIKYGDSYQLRDGRPAHYFNSKVDKKFWAPTMSQEELILKFRHYTTYDYEVMNATLFATTGDAERIHSGLSAYLKSGAGNKELNSLLSEFVRGKRATPVSRDVKIDIDTAWAENYEFIHEGAPDYDLREASARLFDLIDRTVERGRASVGSCQRIFMR